MPARWIAILTVIIVILLAVVGGFVLDWAILRAIWSADSAQACRDIANSGACWSVIAARFWQLLYGFYPAEEYWRVNTVFILFALTMTPILTTRVPGRRFALFALLVPFPILSFFLLQGLPGSLLPLVVTAKWGGLTLTLLISVTAMIASLPVGVILALARQSRMRVISLIATGFIETVRGVPLITILFMASAMFPLFMPEGVSVNELVRALVGVSLFSSAYMAEVIRGGLQALPKGQYEAASSLSIGYWRSTHLVILPQALNIMIPGIVNTFIGLLKDTSLVSIIGLFDLLLIGKTAVVDAKWLGLEYEMYIVLAIMYLIMCSSMSFYSRRLEAKSPTALTGRR